MDDTKPLNEKVSDESVSVELNPTPTEEVVHAAAADEHVEVEFVPEVKVPAGKKVEFVSDIEVPTAAVAEAPDDEDDLVDEDPVPLDYNDGWNDAVNVILAALDAQVAHGPAGEQEGIRIARGIAASFMKD